MAFQIEDFDYSIPRDAISKELCHHLRPDMHGVAFVRRLYGFNQLPYAFGHAALKNAVRFQELESRSEILSVLLEAKKNHPNQSSL